MRAIGGKTTLVHGSRDRITTLQRLRVLARDTGATVILLDSDHHGYSGPARRQIIEAIAKVQ